jgi:protein arginine phosphatase
MAGGLARKIAAAKGTSVEVRTAGVAAHNRRPVAQLAVEAMREVDVDISQDYSKPVTRDLVEWADLMVAVEKNLALELRHRHPDMASKVNFLDRDVPDPLRSDATLADYVKCRDLLEELLLKLPIWRT